MVVEKWLECNGMLMFESDNDCRLQVGKSYIYTCNYYDFLHFFIIYFNYRSLNLKPTIKNYIYFPIQEYFLWTRQCLCLKNIDFLCLGSRRRLLFSWFSFSWYLKLGIFPFKSQPTNLITTNYILFSSAFVSVSLESFSTYIFLVPL